MIAHRPLVSTGSRTAARPALIAFALTVLAMMSATPASASPDRVYRSGFEPGIDAVEETWTWVDVEGSECGNGSATGIGVNLTTKSDRVLIFLAGGGACWDNATCYQFQTATNFISGYTSANFAVDVADTNRLAKPDGFFDRSSPTNPLRDYSYVVVPYCTGDVHAGNNIVTFDGGTAHFSGYHNMALYLARVADTFPQLDRVVLAGSSAGGFGAAFNWWQTAEAFPGVRVDMIDDSGALMPEDVLGATGLAIEVAQRTNWNLAATLPPGCSACATAFDVIFGFYANEFPDSRGALLSFVVDTTLPSFYQISSAAFSQGLGELETQQFDPSANLRYFTYNVTSGHVLWFSPGLTTNGVTLEQFITQMVTDDLNWVSQKP